MSGVNLGYVQHMVKCYLLSISSAIQPLSWILGSRQESKEQPRAEQHLRLVGRLQVLEV